MFRSLLGALCLALALMAPGLAAHAQTTGFRIADPAIADFYDQHDGPEAFGEPISREFTLAGNQLQIFDNAVLRIVPDDGSVQVLKLMDPTVLPYTRIDGLTIPSDDPSVGFVAPTPDQPNYDARLQGFLDGLVPPQLQPIYQRDLWGLPTSFAIPDPNNPNFLYQRFENGVLFYDTRTGTAAPLPLGRYFKAILSKQNLPPDLASEAARSPFLGLAPPDAFVPDA